MTEINPIEKFNVRLAHIGINAANAEEGADWAREFLELLGLPVRETPVSYFSSELIEIMKENGRGTRGHLGFATEDCDGLLAYFKEKGLNVIESTRQVDEAGKTKFAYLDREVVGFAIHVIRG